MPDSRILTLPCEFFYEPSHNLTDPVPIGLDPTLEHDYYVTEKHRIWERDLPLLRDMNVNMIRLYGWNNALDHTAFLDACFNGGLQSIFVALTFWFPKQDLTDTFVRSKLKRHFAAMVASVQSHPAIAMYLIGNEFNSASWYGASAEQLQSFVELANDLGAIAHELDPNHVVALPLSDEKLVDFIATWDSKLANIDIWALQLYRGLTYGNFFNVVANVTTRPLLMSEFGIDAWDDRAGAVSEDMQAEAAVALWNEIEAASNVTIGGIAFAFSDEWWKSRVADRDARHPNCPESNPFVQSTCGHSNSALPDGYSNEEYYGMFSISQGEGARADSMTPRKVVDAIRVAFLRSRKAGVQPSLLVDYGAFAWTAVSVRLTNCCVDQCASVIQLSLVRFQRQSRHCRALDGSRAGRAGNAGIVSQNKHCRAVGQEGRRFAGRNSVVLLLCIRARVATVRVL